jgi:hypothetical protein
MKRLRIAFTDYLNFVNPEKNFWTQLLRERYEVAIAEDFTKADVLFYSDWGTNHRKSPGRKIYTTGENMIPDYDECDFAITSGLRPGDKRHYRLPYYVSATPHPETLIKGPGFDAEKALASKTGFCCFVASNSRAPERNRFFKLLNRRKRVDSGGRHFNNLGRVVADKSVFIASYKFVIAFENSSTPGYTTEKIVEPMLAGSIPIYWGNPNVSDDFNTRSFINAADFPSLEALADHVLEVDANDSLYLNYLREPWFHGNRIPHVFRLEPLRDALVNFIESGEGPRPRRYRKRRLREHVFRSRFERTIVSLACRIESQLWRVGLRFP